jgi:hypothetical protein
MAKIVKSKRILGKNLVFRNVECDDAEFILKLRNNPTNSKYLSVTSASVEDQRNWILAYAKSMDQAYFVISDREGSPLGCVRIYDPTDHSYTWGSWILLPGLSPMAAMESALMVYSYGKHLGFKDARIDVRQSNLSVWRFHEKFSQALLIRETPQDRYYVVREEAIDRLLHRYQSLVSNPLLVEPLVSETL